MFARKVTLDTTPVVVVDGTYGSATNPVRALIHVPSGASGTALFGGEDLDSATNYIEFVPGAYAGIDLVGEPLYGMSATTCTVEILAAGTPTA